MTLEKQADVRNKLYAALGDRGHVAAATSATTVGAARGTVTAAAAAAPKKLPPAPTPDKSSKSLPSKGSAKAVENEISSADKPSAAPARVKRSWRCEVCTLINDPSEVVCTACGMPIPEI